MKNADAKIQAPQDTGKDLHREGLTQEGTYTERDVHREGRT